MWSTIVCVCVFFSSNFNQIICYRVSICLVVEYFRVRDQFIYLFIFILVYKFWYVRLFLLAFHLQILWYTMHWKKIFEWIYKCMISFGGPIAAFCCCSIFCTLTFLFSILININRAKEGKEFNAYFISPIAKEKNFTKTNVSIELCLKEKFLNIINLFGD